MTTSEAGREYMTRPIRKSDPLGLSQFQKAKRAELRDARRKRIAQDIEQAVRERCPMKPIKSS